MKKSILTLVGVSLLASGIAVKAAEESTMQNPAAEPAAEAAKPAEAINPKIHAKFKKLDKNKDGFIEKSEAKRNKLLNKEFNKIAKEGKLDEASFAAWETSHAKPAKKKAAQ